MSWSMSPGVRPTWARAFWMGTIPPPDGVVVQDSLHLPLEEGGAVSGVVEDVAQGGVADQHRPGGGEEHLLRVLAADQPVFGKVHAPQGQDAHLHGVSR